jgi:hypothetical protein
MVAENNKNENKIDLEKNDFTLIILAPKKSFPNG